MAGSRISSNTVRPPIPVRIEEMHRFRIARPARASTVGGVLFSKSELSDVSAANSWPSRDFSVRKNGCGGIILNSPPLLATVGALVRFGVGLAVFAAMTVSRQ